MVYEESHGANGGSNGHGKSHPPNTTPHGNRMTDHQKQGIILLLLSAIIYVACQFDATLKFVVPEDVEGPKPTTNIQMIALIGERNSGTRWTSE